jgi:hypothetical protein
MKIKITIITKPYIKKFLCHEVGPEIVIDKRNLYGNFLLSQFTVPQQDNHRFSEESYCESLTATLPARLLAENRIHLSLNAMMSFNGFVDEIMRRLLLQYVENVPRSRGNKGENSIKFKTLEFFQRYEIEEEEFSLDAALKYIQREDTRNKLSTQMSLFGEPARVAAFGR